MNTISSKLVTTRSRVYIIATSLIILTTGCFAQTDAEPDSNALSADRTVLITGANRGIGLELARQYAADGWQVIGTARKPQTASALASLDVRIMQLDVTDQESVDRLAAELGDVSIDLLINNAGILPRMHSIDAINIDDVNRTLAVNTVGPMRVTGALLAALRSGQSGKIVNITSQLGSITNNTGGSFYGYRESKAALNMFTRSLAAELRSDGIICVVVHPGWVQTDMGGTNATLTAEQSVSGIRSVIDGLEQSDTGTFWNYDGRPLPW
jgi:NAD(P)-dependent dehydrogenase (short-subunit alcohol dehydrogenase family)